MALPTRKHSRARRDKSRIHWRLRLPTLTTCPQCGKPLAVKDGRFGEFTACSAYPECKYIKLKEVGLDCPRPECGGRIVERRSRRGRTFFGCNRYPECDFSVWNRPVPAVCPACGTIGAEARQTKARGEFRKCLKCGTEFPADAGTPEPAEASASTE